MSLRYRAAMTLTLVIALGAPAAGKPPRAAVPAPNVSPPPAADVLYSRRALRRARTVLQLKLLELREQRLERVRKAIERGLPVDELLKIHR